MKLGRGRNQIRKGFESSAKELEIHAALRTYPASEML